MPNQPTTQRLYLLRHGETDYNARSIVQGSGIDSDLNQAGRLQAQWFYERHRFTRFESLHASALKRTQQTLEPFREDYGQIHVHPGLNEFHWGEFEGRCFDEQCKREVQHIVDAWAAGELELRVPGGESPAVVWERARLALQEIIESHPQGGNILICTHGRMLRVILSNLLAEGAHRMQDFRHQNTGLNILQRSMEGFAAEVLNDISHLP